MKFILFKRTEGGFRQVPTLWVLAAVLPVSALGLVLGVVLVNFMNPPAQASADFAQQNSEYEQALVDLGSDLEVQLSSAKEAVELATENADAQLRVMSSRVAELQARLARMETVARNLANAQPDMAVAVDFSAPVALGGPGLAEDVVMTDVVNQLSLLEARLADRERQLGVLENLVIGDDVAARLSPKGRPIVEGWLSSPFGKRTDPFTGKDAWHNGIDFAGAEGGEIIAVADGIVTYAGRRHGYGLMVEVTHADGYATRYAHNRENLVALGTQVVAGEVIARMGMTGRSTGPHVHFELLKNGKKLNPWKVVASRRQ